MATGTQRLFVLLLIALSLGLLVPEFVPTWVPFGTFGMQFATDGSIVEVAPGSFAARAGVRAGDRIDLERTPLASRRWIETGVADAPDGTASPFSITHDGHTRTLLLRAAPGIRSEADDVTNAILALAWIAFVVIAGSLCFLTPSRMTWTFFAYALVACVTSLSVVPAVVSLGWFIALLCFQLTGATSGLVLLLFALRFPANEAPGWRRPAENAALVAILVTLALAEYAGLKTLIFPGHLAGALFSLVGIIEIAGTIAAIATFAIAYTQSPIGDRARFRWVFTGLATGQTGLIVFQVLTTIPAVTIAWPPWLINIVLTLQLAVPVTIAYAVVRHRIFDVRIVMSRALVYALLTAILVGCIAAVKYIANAVLVETRTAAVLELLVTIALGVVLNAGYKRLEQIVDSVLYRHRTRAGIRLRRLAGGLIYATSAASIVDSVTRETYDALALTSTALFRRGDGVFVRVAALGWDDTPLAPLAVDAPAVLAMAAEPTPVRFEESTWPGTAVPNGMERPVLAVPISVRGSIEAIAFFGSHRSGEDIDGEELAILTLLLRAAGEALDKLAIEAMRERLASLELQMLRTLGRSGNS